MSDGTVPWTESSHHIPPRPVDFMYLFIYLFIYVIAVDIVVVVVSTVIPNLCPHVSMTMTVASVSN